MCTFFCPEYADPALAIPRRIKSGKEARTLVDVGEKVAMRVGQTAVLQPLTIADRRVFDDRTHCRVRRDPRFFTAQDYRGVCFDIHYRSAHSQESVR